MAPTADSPSAADSNGAQPSSASQQARPPTAPNGRAERISGYFPLGYKEGFSQWWAGLTPAQTEHQVLSFIPHLHKPPPTHTETGTVSAPESASTSQTDITDDAMHKAAPVTSNSDVYGPRRWHSNLVKLSGKDRALNEFSVERLGEEVENHLVMLHGYGAGLGFFYKNFEALSRAPGWRLYALDLLGMGRSSRPPFRIHAKDHQGKITEAENWFVDALEEWRIQKKIDRFTLLGHSLGGYMAVAYALKYPGHLNKLILASPVGIPEDPYAVAAEMPDPEDFSQDQEPTNSGRTGAQGDRHNSPNRGSKDKDSRPPARRPLPKWLTYLWDANISPFSLVRWSGPLGPRLVSGWTSRRFSHLPPEEAQALHDYSYSLFRQRGSGEYALAYILAPGAFARSPLIRRIHGVGRQYLGAHRGPIPDAPEPSSSSSSSSATDITRSTAPAPASASSRPRENGVPVVLMYGEHDWMDVAGGYAAASKIQEEKVRALAAESEEERRRDQGGAKVLIIKRAGHHVYLDGWEEFNSLMLREMGDVEKREQRRKAWGEKGVEAR